MRLAFAFLALLVPAFVACGGTNARSTPSAQPTPAVQAAKALLPLRDMRYVSAGKGAIGVILVVHADGRLDRPGKQGAKIVGGRVVCDDGSELIRVDADDAVHFFGKIVAHLRDGAFVVGHDFGEWKVDVRDDGDIQLWTHSEGATSGHELRWEGFAPDARRTASLFTGFFSPAFGGAWCGEPPATNPM